MGARLYQIGNILLTVVATCFYIGAFASTGWVCDDQYDYGFWKRCETNTTRSDRCYSLTMSNQKGYFEAARTLATFALVSCIFCVITCFLDDNEEDVGCRQKCYRYIFCFSILFSVALKVIVMAVLGGGYKDDPTFINPELGWCFPFTAVSAVLALLGGFCRARYIALEHHTACLRSFCCLCCGEDLSKTFPSNAELNGRSGSLDAASMENARSKLPPLLIGTSSAANSDSVDGRIVGLPPLPFKPRGGLTRSGSLRSTDSGLDSRDISKDSILDETAGPVPLSIEMLKRHDRRLNGATGRRDDRRCRPAFSSTTSLSTTDSQSSAELAPRVHTPTNKKRVHYDIPQNNEEQRSQEASFSEVPMESEPPPSSLYPEPENRRESLAAPIISFPIKVQGVELSRAKTNARTTATLENIRLKATSLKRMQNANKISEEQQQQQQQLDDDLIEGAEVSQPSNKKKRKKEKKEKDEMSVRKDKKQKEDKKEKTQKNEEERQKEKKKQKDEEKTKRKKKKSKRKDEQ